MASEIKESESPPSQSQRADPPQSQSAAKLNKAYVFFWHAYSSVMYSLYEIEVPKPLPPPPDEATQADEIKNPKKLLPVLQLKTGQYPDGMSCVSLGSKLYFVGGEFNMDNPYIDEDVKINFKDSELDVFPRQLLILDLSEVGASGDELHKLRVDGEQMRSGKARPHAFVAEEKIYVIGSTIESSISHRSKLTRLNLKSFVYFEVYDPEFGQWHDLPDPPIGSVKTRWVGHAIVRRKALLVAWQGGKERLYCFDLGESCWEKETHASIPFYPENFSGRTEFVEDTLYGCYHNTIAAIAPVEEKKIEKEEKNEKKRKREKIEGKKVKAEHGEKLKRKKVKAEEGEKIEEKKLEAEQGEKMEAEKVKAKETLEVEEEEKDAKDFGQEWLLENLHLHVLSEEMGMDAIFNVPPQLQSSSSLLHLGNRYFCYVKSGMPPNSDDDSDDDIKDDKKRFISIVIFRALWKKYEEDGTGLLQAQFLYSAHYEINSPFPNEGFINGCFFRGSLVQPRTETMVGDFVGGAVLSAFLQVTLDRVASREVLDYLNGRKLIERLVRKLKLELMSAGAVLSDAEKKQVTDPAVKKWLDELKDAIYVADDLLDEIVYEAMRCKLEAESTITSKVMGLLPTFVMGFLPTFVNSFDKRIQSELESILEQLESITKQKDVLRLEKVAAAEVPSRPLTTSCPEEYVVFGRDKDMEAIFDMFQSDDASVNGICVVPIVGMGGIGKTTLAQLIYNNKRFKESFDLTAWVCVSETNDYFRIAKTIFEEVTSFDCYIQTMNLLQTKLREKFRGKKVFIVLDDVWNENYDNWVEFFKVFICGAQEIKIILTTRYEIIASTVGTVSSYILNGLSNEECWLLFEKHAFKNGSSSEFPIFEKIGRKIVQKCRGLPLAAKVLGGLLRFEENPREWIKILESDIWDLPKGNIDILPALRLSYHYLPSHLKCCFAYCSILPKDYEFEKEELVLLWMAEDLLQQYEGNGMMEKIGEQYFDDLVSRSFFQRSSSNQSCFVMHDLVNDLAIFISGEFCFKLENNESCVITRKTRHLSYVRTGYDASKKFRVSYKAKYLRTFLGLDFPLKWWPWNGISTMMLNDLLLTFRCLRVLSFFGYQNMRELPNSIGDLKHLRYLNLSYTSLERLPDSLCNLYKLQTLLLLYCGSLIELPRKMWRLVNLRHLDLVGTNLKEMPLHMGKLRNLVKLTTFVVGEHSGSSIKELGELHHLSGALSILNLQNVHHARDAREVNLKDKQYLSELKFQCGFDNENLENERDVLEQLCPSTKLESLTIEDYGGTKFPNWLEDCSFSKMMSIRLVNCNCLSLPPLGHLPVLKRLYVQGFHFLSNVDREFYGDGSSTIKPFRSLEVLSFEDMQIWREWFLFEGEYEDEGGVFSTLKELRIIKCPELSSHLPRQLPSLIKLEIESILNFQNVHHARDVWEVKFPNWLEGCSFSKMMSIQLVDCNCLSLPPLGHLPVLKRLYVKGFDLVSNVDLEFYGDGSSTIKPFRSLEVLEFEDMPIWREWFLFEGEYEDEGGVFSTLKELRIIECPKLISGLPSQLPSLIHLEIAKCQQLVTSVPRAPTLNTLELSDCDKVVLKELPPKLDYLFIRGDCNFLKSFAELMTCLAVPGSGVPTTLKSLHIQGAFQITIGHYYPSLESLRITDDSDSPWSFPLESYPKLQNLEVCKSEKLVSFLSGGICAPNLISITIVGCNELKSLPENMRTLFPSLEYLKVGDCGELESFPEGGLPLNLVTLDVSYGNKLFFLGLQDLLSLREISICNNWKEVESFPEEALLPPTLTDINISSFPWLKSLKGFQHLTSLKNLRISYCDELEYLPEEGFPTTLSSLIIYGCPLLNQRCVREKGEEWPKIAHIPNVVIDYELIT